VAGVFKKLRLIVIPNSDGHMPVDNR